MLQSIRSHLPWLLTASMVVACGGDDQPADGDETAGTETATETAGTEDEIGDGDASTTTTDDDTTTTDDGSCPVGSEGCPCTGGGGCDPGLVCMGGLCTPPAPDTTGPDTDDDETTTDTTETTDATETETTTTDTGGACDEDVSFEILATDANEVDGWEPAMSMLGEGMIMAWDQQNDQAFISWDIDIPCDGTWHIWIRGIDQGQADSYFAVVDGEPNPPPIFELDCTAGPNQGTYLWKELNYRDQADPACTYLFDPWTQDWATGTHNFTLLYRESGAVSRIWITNTDQTPP
jgi:hypothetical protein